MNILMSDSQNRIEGGRLVEGTRMQVRQWLVRGAVVGLVMVGAGVSGCRYGLGAPLGAHNNTRVADTIVAHRWAEPLERPGLPNLHKVSDDLYRGAQPTAEGMQQLRAMGVQTVVNLRISNSNHHLSAGPEQAEERIPMTAWFPSDEEAVRFLRIVTDESRQPVFVHCRRGADRTGMMVAIYRVAVQGWDKEEAITEMTQGGFRFNHGWQNLVRYVRDLDIDAIRRRAGLEPQVGPVPTTHGPVE
jgi:protein tyrosine phosphatase (PTP) superfamily phosphohydrolase (DUF442 family)